MTSKFFLTAYMINESYKLNNRNSDNQTIRTIMNYLKSNSLNFNSKYFYINY